MVGSVRGVFSGSLNLLYMAINFGCKPVTKPITTSVNNKPNIVEVLTQYFEYIRDSICLIISQIYLSCTQFKMLTRATQYFESRKGKVLWNYQMCTRFHTFLNHNVRNVTMLTHLSCIGIVMFRSPSLMLSISFIFFYD